MLLACPFDAYAQAPTDQATTTDSAYQQTVDEAVREFSLGNYAEARALLLRAHELAPSARTLRGLAKADFELRNYRRCMEYIEQALSSDLKPLTQSMREDLLDLKRRAQGFVATVEFKLSPPRAEVTIDGAEAELSESSTAVVDVGEHLVQIRAPGHQETELKMKIDGEQSRVVEVALVPLGDVTREDVPADKAPSEVSKRRRRWAWALAAVAVVAGASVGAGLALRSDGSPGGSGGSSGIDFTF